MDNKSLLKAFWNCGDNQIIEFALQRARLNRFEKEILHYMFDECLTQEQIAEMLDVSTRYIQNYWYSGASKLLGIPWVQCYAKELNVH